MNKINKHARPDRFLKPVRSLLLLILLCFCGFAFATPTTPTSDFIDNGDGTVTHKLTGLVWMRCAMGQTWTGSTCSGSENDYTWTQAKALKPTFAGKSDWRLPNIAELLTIVEREKYNPAINITLFPNTSNDWFWSSSPTAYFSNYAWVVRFGYGSDNGGHKYGYDAVRLVRGEQWLFGSLPLTTPTNDFTDNQNGTVTHKRTGLMWQRCEVGQTWSGVTCLGTPTTKTYAQALALTSSLAGYTDWHVPTIDELLTLVEYGAYYPAINSTLFPHASSSDIWSSTSYVADNSTAWVGDFSNGYSYAEGKTNSLGGSTGAGKMGWCSFTQFRPHPSQMPLCCPDLQRSVATNENQHRPKLLCRCALSHLDKNRPP